VARAPKPSRETTGGVKIWSSPARRETLRRRATALKDHRILLVEDDRDIREAFAEVLEGSGYGVDTAENGLEALELLDERRNALPCLILLDLMMPVMTGWEFRARQLDDPQLSSIPVLVVTGVPNPEKHETLRPAGYVRKPMSVDDVLKVVGEYC
jgi:CheY-like chemotaxis protein